MNRRFGVVFGALMVLTLQACETPPPNPTTADQPTVSTVSVAPARIDTPVQTPTEAARAPRKPSLSPEERDPKRLLTMSQQTLSSLLGKPQFVRREAGARVWQYRSDICVLDLFLYHVAATHQVVHYEFRPAKTLSGPTPGCFETLLTRAADIASG